MSDNSKKDFKAIIQLFNYGEPLGRSIVEDICAFTIIEARQQIIQKLEQQKHQGKMTDYDLIVIPYEEVHDMLRK